MQRNAIGSLIFALHLHRVLGYIERTERFIYGVSRNYRSGRRAGLRTQRNKACEILGVTLGIPKRNGYNVVCNAVTH